MHIVLEEIGKSFGGRKVLDGVSLTVDGGETVCLMGPSGCGKTTLLNIVAALLPPDSGSVKGTAGVKMAYVFQEPRLLPWKTVLGNVEFVLPEGMPPEEKRERALACLEAVELAGDSTRYPQELSGGMAGRVSLARALACDAELILMDEPFSDLDQELRDRIISRLKSLWAGSWPAVLVVTHSEAEAQAFGGRVIRLGV